jgi:hypothetical protein
MSTSSRLPSPLLEERRRQPGARPLTTQVEGTSATDRSPSERIGTPPNRGGPGATSWSNTAPPSFVLPVRPTKTRSTRVTSSTSAVSVAKTNQRTLKLFLHMCLFLFFIYMHHADPSALCSQASLINPASSTFSMFFFCAARRKPT